MRSQTLYFLDPKTALYLFKMWEMCHHMELKERHHKKGSFLSSLCVLPTRAFAFLAWQRLQYSKQDGSDETQNTMVHSGWRHSLPPPFVGRLISNRSPTKSKFCYKAFRTASKQHTTILFLIKYESTIVTLKVETNTWHPSPSVVLLLQKCLQCVPS